MSPNQHLQFPPFRPHPLVRGGHLQTLAGVWWRGSDPSSGGQLEHAVRLPDGDELILHDDCPPDWESGNPTVLLVHGLGGCHRSSYMVRIARKLSARGIRPFRLDLRGCGAGLMRCNQPYHAGRSDDVDAAARFIEQLCPGSPNGVVGFSLGGNIVLKWLGERGTELPGRLQVGMAVNPPIDLVASTRNIMRVARGLYDRHFVRILCAHVRRHPRWRLYGPLASIRTLPKRVVEFDEMFTAPLSGFRSALHYYEECSAQPLIPQIAVPTMVLTSADDPLIPVSMFTGVTQSSQVRLHVEPAGGHLGYVGASGQDPDRYWMDWRVLDWMGHALKRAA
jgi:hypothetical protein